MRGFLKRKVSVFLVFMMLLSIWGFNGIQAAAQVVEDIPHIASVELEHEPFLQGENNSLIVSSEKFSEKVQYQVFYTCEKTMGNKWNLVSDSDMIKGWTKPVDGEEKVNIDLAQLNLENGYYRFAVRVKRANEKGKYKNFYGEYDNAYGFCFNVDRYDVINVKLGYEPRTLDSSRASSKYSKQVLNEITEGLTRKEQDENGEDIVKPAGAKSWECNEAGTEWTFNLRDFSWEDGKKVTAQDYAYGILRTLNPEVGAVNSWLINPIIKNAEAYNMGEVDESAVGVEAVDDKTLKITLEKPCPYFLEFTYLNVMYPLREDIVEKYPEDYGMDSDRIIGCGPFVIDSWVHNEKIVLKKNNTYWDKDSVKIHEINMKITRSGEEIAVEKMLNNELDISSIIKKNNIEALSESDLFNNTEIYAESVNYICFNQKNKYFKNDKIRKAFIIAQDREREAQVYDYCSEPAYSWCPPGVQIAGEDFRKKINDEPTRRLIEENKDPKTLLIEGLKEIGEDQDPAKMDIKIIIYDTTPSYSKMAEALKKTYKEKLGVNMEIEKVNFAVKMDMIDQLDYDLVDGGWVGDYNDPLTYFEMWQSSFPATKTGWQNEEYNQLINTAAESTDNAERLEALKRAENILLYEEGVISPATFRRAHLFIDKKIKNVMHPMFGNLELKYAYIEE